jgi:hypothetical protein
MRFENSLRETLKPPSADKDLHGKLKESPKVSPRRVVKGVVSELIATQDGPAERREASKREPKVNLD